MSQAEVSSFWDHLDVLRKVLFRCLIAWAIGAMAAFCFKETLFDLLFAPSRDDFISYRIMAWLCTQTPVHAMEMPGSRYDIGDIVSYREVQATYHGIQ